MMHYCGFCQMLFRLLITNNVLLNAKDAKLFNPPMRQSLICSILLFALVLVVALISRIINKHINWDMLGHLRI